MSKHKKSKRFLRIFSHNAHISCYLKNSARNLQIKKKKKRTVEEELLYLTGETVKVILSIRERCAENIFVYREKK